MLPNYACNPLFEPVRVWTPKVLLLGFHGTISSCRWEEQTVLPLVLSSMEQYLRIHANDQEVQLLVESLRAESFIQRFQQHREDAPLVECEETSQENNQSIINNSIISTLVRFIIWQIKNSRESDECLYLQRRIWQHFLRTGKLKTHIYSDVAKILPKWKQMGIKIALISSVNEHEQRLFLQFTDQDDLSSFFECFLDREYGSRINRNTFITISEKFQVPASSIVYLTHLGKEAKAASQAGLQSVLVIRPENTKMREYYLLDFPSISSFDQLKFVQSNNVDLQVHSP